MVQRNTAQHQAGNRSIQLICGDPRWLGDSEPIWLEGRGKKSERRSKTAAGARFLRERTARLLRRSGGDATTLADHLGQCTRFAPCTSGACPVCARALQRWFVASVRLLVRSEPDHGLDLTNLLMVTISPDFGRAKLDAALPAALLSTTVKLRRLLSAAGVHTAFGGIDFSVNYEVLTPNPCVQIHACLFVPKDCWPTQDRRLRKGVNRSGEVSRPINVKKFDGDNAGLGYALKYEFNRRETYQQASDGRPDGRSCRNTRIRPLQGNYWVQLMLLVHQIGLDKRVFLTGVKRTRMGTEVALQLLA